MVSFRTPQHYVHARIETDLTLVGLNSNHVRNTVEQTRFPSFVEAVSVVQHRGAEAGTPCFLLSEGCTLAFLLILPWLQVSGNDPRDGRRLDLPDLGPEILSAVTRNSFSPPSLVLV